MTIAILWWAWLLALLTYSAIGAVRLRASTGTPYARFVYTCALGVAVLPILSGDWVWSAVYVPIALIFARLIIRRHDDQVRDRGAEPPPSNDR